MTPSAIRQYLDERLELAPGTKIQYGHPSPRYWTSAPASLDRLLAPARPDRGLALYLHIPFCVPTKPSACGFCLFAREDLGRYEAVRDYVDTLLIELQQVAARLGPRPVRCVYFGGGTPNVLRPPEIERLFRGIRDILPVEPDAEISFEGYPPLFTTERLEALAAEGCTRLSLGVQTLDPTLIEYSGRDAARARTEAAIRFCRQRGIRCNADLITGWFGQRPGHLVADIEQLVDWGVTGICNHLLALGGTSPFAARRDELPTHADMAQAFAAARGALLARGFRMDGYIDFAAESVPVVRYLEMYRDVLRHDRIGVGYGANSLLAGTLDAPGHTWKNVSDLDEYRARVRSGRAAADTCFEFELEDLRLLFVLKGLEGSPWITRAAWRSTFGGELEERFEPWWREFERRGWLTWADGPRLEGDGLYYTALVQRCLSEPRNRQLRARAPSPRRDLVSLARR